MWEERKLDVFVHDITKSALRGAGSGATNTDEKEAQIFNLSALDGKLWSTA